MDAEIQDMDRSQSVVQVFIQATCQPVVSRPWIQGHLL